MGLGKDGFYTTAEIKKYKAQYNVILGERAPGKSYRVKSDNLRKAWKEQKATFILIRRYESDIKTDFMQSYFADNMRHDKCYGDVEEITGGEYSNITVFRGKIYFSNVDDKGKAVLGPQCGRTMALNLDERYKSQQFPDVTDIIFEEFVTRDLYLRDECPRLMNLVSTIARGRDITVWLIANTISRVCPYFQEWNLVNIPKMTPGTIDTYTIDNTKIAVEFCHSRGGKSKMFFGETAKSIQGGAWETKTVPHLPKEYSEYDVIYEMYVRESGFTFKLELLMDDDAQQLLYVYPYTKRLKDDINILCADFSPDPAVRPYLRKNIPAECIIAKLFQDNKIVYASNLTGADFKACINNMQGGFLLR